MLHPLRPLMTCRLVIARRRYCYYLVAVVADWDAITLCSAFVCSLQCRRHFITWLSYVRVLGATVS